MKSTTISFAVLMFGCWQFVQAIHFPVPPTYAGSLGGTPVQLYYKQSDYLGTKYMTGAENADAVRLLHESKLPVLYETAKFKNGFFSTEDQEEHD